MVSILEVKGQIQESVGSLLPPWDPGLSGLSGSKHFNFCAITSHLFAWMNAMKHKDGYSPVKCGKFTLWTLESQYA